MFSLGGKEHFDKRKISILSNKIKMFSVMVGIGMLPSSISSCILCGIYSKSMEKLDNHIPYTLEYKNP